MREARRHHSWPNIAKANIFVGKTYDRGEPDFFIASLIIFATTDPDCCNCQEGTAWWGKWNLGCLSPGVINNRFLSAVQLFANHRGFILSFLVDPSFSKGYWTVFTSDVEQLLVSEISIFSFSNLNRRNPRLNPAPFLPLPWPISWLWCADLLPTWQKILDWFSILVFHVRFLPSPTFSKLPI